MRWDRFFEDLEDQLDSEWEAERAALDTEAERLRLSRVPLRERLVALAGDPREVGLHLGDGSTVAARISRVGMDWVAAVPPPTSPGGAFVVPLWALAGIGVAADALLASVRDADAGPRLGQRISFGFVLRDLVRRRIAVSVQAAGGHTLSGTIDRAGADHLDLALHEPGAQRRGDNVTGYRMIPFAAVLSVRLASASDLS